MIEPEILSEKVEFEKDWIKIKSAKIKFPNGNVAEWCYPVCDSGVAIVPVDGDRNVYLVREWRLAYNRFITQIPAGQLEGAETEEDIQKKAHAELREEIGFDCKTLEKLTCCFVTSKIKYAAHIYLATGLFKSQKPADENEYVDVIKLPLADAIAKFTSAEQTNSYTLIGLMLARDRLK